MGDSITSTGVGLRWGEFQSTLPPSEGNGTAVYLLPVQYLVQLRRDTDGQWEYYKGSGKIQTGEVFLNGLTPYTKYQVNKLVTW